MMDFSENTKRDKWNLSFSRGDNNILYPQIEVIRFLNKFVAKRRSIKETNYIIEAKNRKLRCLDFGCGIGTHAIICEDFNIQAYGVDISYEAISQAKENALQSGQSHLVDRLFVIDNDSQELIFNDYFFDCVIAESCLDSMKFEIAKRYMAELKRVCRKKIYFSVISSESSGGQVGEFLVEGQHENGTIQSYFDLKKIERLTSCSVKNFDYLQLVTAVDQISESVSSARYYCVLDVQSR